MLENQQGLSVKRAKLHLTEDFGEYFEELDAPEKVEVFRVNSKRAETRKAEQLLGENVLRMRSRR